MIRRERERERENPQYTIGASELWWMIDSEWEREKEREEEYIYFKSEKEDLGKRLLNGNGTIIVSNWCIETESSLFEKTISIRDIVSKC